jgi:hypothetical protein
MTKAEYQTEQINENLIGFKITGTILDSTGEYFGLKLQKGKKTIAIWMEFVKPDLGNGAGSIKIEKDFSL